MFKWERWIKNKEECDKAFNKYIEEEIVNIENEKKDLSKSHLNKLDYNLDFVNNLLKQKKFYDWVIVGCYYTIYHAALALLSVKGYSSKNNSATLCALIHLYYRDLDTEEETSLTKEDIELIAKSSIDKEEVTYFVEAKNKRETTPYGVGEEFNKNQAEKLKVKTVLFVNKTKEILEKF